MKTLVVGLFTIVAALFLVQPVVAASSDIVISQVQAGAMSAPGSATQEFITIYNNSSASVDITNWCLHTNSGEIGCFEPEVANESIHLDSKKHALIVSASFLTTHPETLIPDVSYDIVFPVKNATSGSIVGSSDVVRLLDSSGNEKDAASWTTALSGGQLLIRKSSAANQLLDTDNPVDFTKSTVLSIPVSGVTFQRTSVDICSTVEGLQETLPAGYGFDEYGNCDLLVLDLCENIELIQLEYPEGMLADEQKSCMVDVCENIVGLQVTLPDFHSAEGRVCEELEQRSINITELLPNVTGSDTGREFIELYNPHNEPLLLSGYTLKIGKTFEKDFRLEDLEPGLEIQPYSYLVIYDSQLGFNLLNTNSGIRVVAPAGNIVIEVQYNEPPNDHSWSLIDGTWEYSNRPTPGQMNYPSLFIESDDPATNEILGLATSNSLTACLPGKYRHPITNRCRNIENDTVMLVICDNDEYRNPETNRCRKTAILTSTLSACAEGSERNLETNRCRKIETTASTLASCQTGYERNAETNRCRKALLAASSAAGASGPVVKKEANNTLTNALVFTAGFSAVGYGLYEWRTEFFRGLRRLSQLVSGK